MKEIDTELYEEIDREMCATWMNLVPREPLPFHPSIKETARVVSGIDNNGGPLYTEFPFYCQQAQWRIPNKEDLIQIIKSVIRAKDLEVLEEFSSHTSDSPEKAFEEHLHSGGDRESFWLPGYQKLVLFHPKIMTRYYCHESKYWWADAIFQKDGGSYHWSIRAAYKPVLTNLGHIINLP